MYRLYNYVYQASVSYALVLCNLLTIRLNGI
jgi:hypothetical protein